MDLQSIINLAAGTTLAIAGWFTRELWGAVKELRADLAKLREEIPKGYVGKEDFKGAVDGMRDEMRENFARLFDKLDRKQDK
jgi:hypothetical protein